jgi:hypothetical protein
MREKPTLAEIIKILGGKCSLIPAYNSQQEKSQTQGSGLFGEK